MFSIFRLSFLLLFLSSTHLFADNFPVSEIPDNMKKGANSVIRRASLNVEITSKFQMTETYEWAITVFNSAGNDHIITGVGYRSSQKITELSAVVYDRNGKEIKKFKQSDGIDESAVSNASIFEDSRVKSFRYNPVTYPYTFVFKVQRKGSNTAFIPDWIPVGHEFQSVVSSSYQLIYPADWKLYVSEFNFDSANIQRTNIPGIYTASLTASEAFTNEYGSPSRDKFLSNAQFSLNHFELEGYEGKADDWAEFGKWYNSKLLKDIQTVPEKTRIEIVQLTQNTTDTIEKARLIYEYVQKKTRYVNVAIGIGGWKPLSVEQVDQLGYGDCKALSLYTKALMESVGIPASYCIVYAGNDQKSIDTNQVAVQGNHVFVRIPLADTTIWLETTSQTAPFGYSGTFTDNRYILSLLKDTALIIKTPESKDTLNKQSTTAYIQMFDDGTIQAKINLKSEGLQYDLKDNLLRLKYEDKEKHYHTYWNYLQRVVLTDIQTIADKRSINIIEEVNLEAQTYATMSGERMLFIANFFNRSTYIPPRYSNRKQCLQILRGYNDIDTYEITIPEGFKLEAAPSPVQLSTQFGSYSLSIQSKNETTLLVNRQLLTRNGTFPADSYRDYLQFKKDIAKFDQSKIVLIKQ